MQTEVIDLEYERYKDWDMSNAKPANTHPLVKKLQNNVRLAQDEQDEKHTLLDDDVFAWFSQQDTDTRVHVNEMIRQVMAIDKQHKENLA